jgi:hypothetical protein
MSLALRAAAAGVERDLKAKGDFLSFVIVV